MVFDIILVTYNSRRLDIPTIVVVITVLVFSFLNNMYDNN